MNEDDSEPQITNLITNNNTSEEASRNIQDAIDNLLKEQKVLKEEADKRGREQKYEEAEAKYNQIIENLKAFKPENMDLVYSEENKAKGLEVIQFTKEVYSNLCLVQGKMKHYGAAMTNASYIIQYLDDSHDKSYIRILNWLVATGQITQANYVANEVKIKFTNKELEKFKSIFMILELKTNEINLKQKTIQDNIFKEKIRIARNGLIYGGISLISAIGLMLLYKKYKK